MKTDPNEFIMPVAVNDIHCFTNALTKREHFAAMFMQAMIDKEGCEPRQTSISAVKYAEALIQALNGETTATNDGNSSPDWLER